MDSSGRTFMIAEAGVNHNGSRDLALELVEAAAEAGADAVKFQTFAADRLVTRAADKAEYQKRATGDQGRQHAMLRGLELGEDDHVRLRDRASELGIEFLSTPFDLQSLEFLVGFGVSRIKLGSGELTNGPLLLAAGRSGKPVVLSTGMGTLAEVESALGVLAHGLVVGNEGPPPRSLADALASAQVWEALEQRVTLLHCTTEYPASPEAVNLRAIETLRAAFGLRVGLSDHTRGTACALAGVALGAAVIEKHLTTDRSLPGPDHEASLEPDELSAMVRAIREVESAMGDGRKRPAATERANMPVARKSLVAARAIEAGEAFSIDNLTVKRPGTGVSPMRYWEALGRRAARRYEADDLIDLDSKDD